MPIKALNKTDVNRLCSQQVVITLDAAIKELIENSIDAKSTIIEVNLKKQGLDLIEINDNGVGIEADDFPNICLHHATSKIKLFEDLVNDDEESSNYQDTLGFRGEALAALNNISNKVVIATKSVNIKNQALGFKLNFHHANGKLLNQNKIPKSVGTNIQIFKLFDRLPVRRKQLEKSITKEYKKMVKLIQSYGVYYYKIKFLIKNDGKLVQSMNVCKNILDRVPVVFPSLKKQDFLMFSEEEKVEAGVKLEPENSAKAKKSEISGVISKPGNGHSSNTPPLRQIFVNNRPVNISKYEKLICEYWKSEGGWRHHYPMYWSGDFGDSVGKNMKKFRVFGLFHAF